jgi:hypothetical protein
MTFFFSQKRIHTPVTVVLYFMKILSGSRNYWMHLRTTDPSLHAVALKFQKLYFKNAKA